MIKISSSIDGEVSLIESRNLIISAEHASLDIISLEFTGLLTARNIFERLLHENNWSVRLPYHISRVVYNFLSHPDNIVNAWEAFDALH